MKSAFLALMVWLVAASVQAAGFDHGTWNGLLQSHVVAQGQSTQVDYAGMARERARLKTYLDALATVRPGEFDRWPKAERLAFLINAYNAWTVELVLTRYPDLRSIKELGGVFSSPWKKRFIPLLGQSRSLDDIEHGLIRAEGAYEEPRIHFAVNCASVGCPALRNEAYVGDQLDAQLEDATRRFLADRSRNRFNPVTQRLEVSKIFDWYRQDFERGWGGYAKISQFFARHADVLADTESIRRLLRAGQIRLTHLDYDWALNARGSQAALSGSHSPGDQQPCMNSPLSCSACSRTTATSPYSWASC